MKTLFAFTFTPVQEFIAEARRGQDLFAGSYILSQLGKAACDALKKSGAQIVFPVSGGATDYPNKLLAVLDDADTAEKAGARAADALVTRWAEFISHAHRTALQWGLALEDSKNWRETWDRQKPGPWAWHWAAANFSLAQTAESDSNSYSAALAEATWLIDADKRTRTFAQSIEPGMKDTLSGARTALHDDHSADPRQFWRNVQMQGDLTRAKLRPNGRERLDVVGTVKRFGVPDNELPRIASVSTVATEDFLEDAIAQAKDELLNYRDAIRTLMGKSFFRVRAPRGGWDLDGDWFFPETLTPSKLARDYGHEVSAPDPTLQNARNKLATLHDKVKRSPCSYYAIVSLDGDGMGQRLGNIQTQAEHEAFSSQISTFAARVEELVTGFNGQRVYAGGDDVLALFPLSQSLPATLTLAKEFQDVTKNTASAGIAIAHHLTPLDQTLRASRLAEAEAKRVPGKGAFCLSIDKRGGAPLIVAMKPGSVDYLMTFVGAIATGVLSSRFPGDVRLLAGEFSPVVDPGPFGDAAARKAAFASQANYELRRHYIPSSQPTTFDEASLYAALNGLIRESDLTPIEIGDLLLAARFIGKRGVE